MTTSYCIITSRDILVITDRSKILHPPFSPFNNCKEIGCFQKWILQIDDQGTFSSLDSPIKTCIHTESQAAVASEWLFQVLSISPPTDMERIREKWCDHNHVSFITYALGQVMKPGGNKINRPNLSQSIYRIINRKYG